MKGTKIQQIETLNMQLIAVMTASYQNTKESRKQRITSKHPYWSVAYSDVCKAVDREIKLIEENKKLKDMLKLKLGKVEFEHYINLLQL